MRMWYELKYFAYFTEGEHIICNFYCNFDIYRTELITNRTKIYVVIEKFVADFRLISYYEKCIFEKIAFENFHAF